MTFYVFLSYLTRFLEHCTDSDLGAVLLAVRLAAGLPRDEPPPLACVV